MSRTAPLVIAAVAAAVPASLLLGFGSGVLPAETAAVPPNLNRGFPGCGAPTCHNPFPNFNIRLDIRSATSVRKGSGNVPVTVSVSGANQASTRGGFSMEVDKGRLLPGLNTRNELPTQKPRPNQLTHKTSLARSWSFAYQPPATTGLATFYATSNAVNGDGRNSGDAWGWYGPDASIPGTPYRIFVDDTAIFPFGTSCPGSVARNSSFRFLPILGIAKNAAVGGAFQSEVYNVPPGTASIGIFGLSNRAWGAFRLPLDLTAFGAKGCFLRVSIDLMQPAVTTGRGAGGGVAKHAWAIPNNTAFRGLDVYFQALTLERGANSLGMTFTMGLRATIQ